MEIKYLCIDGKEYHREMDTITIAQAVFTVRNLQAGEVCELYLDDETDEVPNIGLIFGCMGIYLGYGLGGDDLSSFVLRALDGLENKASHLDKSMAEMLTKILIDTNAKFPTKKMKE